MELFRHEMGFSLIVEEMIKAKKPLIGHNCMYDWVYVYNQFIDELPETFLDFSSSWNKLFPYTFDNKVLALHSKSFHNTALGNLFEKVTNEEKYVDNLKFEFDIKNNFTRYAGQELLSHYHEAAYDAHMTGVVFAHVLKLKDME